MKTRAIHSSAGPDQPSHTCSRGFESLGQSRRPGPSARFRRILFIARDFAGAEIGANRTTRTFAAGDGGWCRRGLRFHCRGFSRGTFRVGPGKIEAPGDGDFKMLSPRARAKWDELVSDNLFFVFSPCRGGRGRGLRRLFPARGVPAAASGVSVGKGVCARGRSNRKHRVTKEADAFGDARR